jgi:hypothetical protein
MHPQQPHTMPLLPNFMAFEDQKDEEIKVQRLHTKCVPDADRLAEAVKTLVGDKGTFRIEVSKLVLHTRKPPLSPSHVLTRLLDAP